MYLVRAHRAVFGLTLLTALLLIGALAAFFVLVAPVNAAFAHWRPATLPADWPAYRLRWELGHALGFALVLGALVAQLRALFLDACLRLRHAG